MNGYTRLARAASTVIGITFLATVVDAALHLDLVIAAIILCLPVMVTRAMWQ